MMTTTLAMVMVMVTTGKNLNTENFKGLRVKTDNSLVGLGKNQDVQIVRTSAKEVSVIADKMNVQWVNAQKLTVAGSDLAALVKQMQIKMTKMQTTIDALSAKIGSTKPTSKPSKIKIIRGRLTEGLNMAALPKTWDFATGPKGKDSSKLFDGNLKTAIGGDSKAQHDELTVVKLNEVCKNGAKFKVYGRDKGASSTDLRHIRTAYSANGFSWKCYTLGNCCGMTTASTQCKWGSQHGSRGMTFSVPGPVQYFMVGTWGNTEIWEIQFVACLGKPLPKVPTQIVAGRHTEGLNMASLPASWNFKTGPKGKDNSKLFDGNLKTAIGGDSRAQHDELTVVKLNELCKKGARFNVYGRDKGSAATALRHIRTAYSANGNNWKCYTKGDCCGMTKASTQCKWGSQHGNNGMTFTVPGPVQYFMVGTWGNTEIWEIQFLACA